MKTEGTQSTARPSFCTLHSALCISRDARTVVIAVVIFAALSATMAVKSDAFLEGDACTHYIYARAAFADRGYLVNVWGRPVCTGVYAVGAHYAGRLGTRLTSLAMAITIALVARSIARGQGWRWPALAAVFTLAQPLVFLHSFSELTELPFALLVGLGFLAYQRRQWFWLAVAVGMTPLSRPEGFGFVTLAAVALLLHRRLRWWPVLVAPLLAWDLAGWAYDGHGPWWRWLADNWPWAGESLYDRGALLKFVAMMPAVAGPFVFPATLVGLWLCLRRSPGGQAWVRTDHRRRCQVLVAVLPLTVLVGHSLLTYFGKMASNGEIRYMLIAAPFWALLAARGWGWTFDRLSWRGVGWWAAVASIAPVGFNRVWGVLPQHPSPDWVEADHIAEWYRSPAVSEAYPHVALAHPGLKYAMDFRPHDPRVVDWNRKAIDAVPPGTLVVWDSVNGVFNSDASRSIPVAELERDGYVEVPTPFTGGAGGWRFFRPPGG